MKINLDRRPNGIFRARWSEGGGRVNWNTGSTDRNEAMRIASEELARRNGTFAPAPPGSPPGQLPAGAPPAPRRGVGEALARVLTPPPASAALPPSGPAPAVDVGALRPDAVMAPEPPEEAVAQVRHVHRVVGKSASHLVEGVLKRCVRYAGREPDDMDDDEKALVEEGCTELAAEYLGARKLTPMGKVLAGSLCAGVGMYMAGKPIPKKQAPPLKLVPPGDPPPGDGSQGA